MIYEIFENFNLIIATDVDGKKLFIPIDEGNSDYQQYLKDTQTDA